MILADGKTKAVKFTRGDKTTRVIKDFGYDGKLERYVPEEVKLGTNVTKLPKVKKELSDHLIKSLQIAVDGGDPNFINTVFSEILKGEKDDSSVVIEYASRVKDGLRHLRNYAKKRGVAGQLLLKQIFQFQKESNLNDKQKEIFGLKPLE